MLEAILVAAFLLLGWLAVGRLFAMLLGGPLVMKGRASFNLRCPKHTNYNPAIQGKGAIRGGCENCIALWKVLQAFQDLKNALHYMDQILEMRNTKGNKCSY